MQIQTMSAENKAIENNNTIETNKRTHTTTIVGNGRKKEEKGRQKTKSHRLLHI